MAYCARCGVEVDNESKKCPLCDAPIVYFDEENRIMENLRAYPEDVPAKKPPYQGNRKQSLQLAVSIITVSFLTPLLILIAVDMRFFGGLTWSQYPAFSLLGLYLLTLLPFIIRKPKLMKRYLPLAYYVVIAGIMIVLDLSDPFGPWALTIGLPIETAAGLLAWFVVIMARKSQKLGANLGGFITLALGLLAAVIEVVIQINTGKPVRLDWSFIVILSLLPISFLLFYIHYHLGRRIDLRKIFHL